MVEMGTAIGLLEGTYGRLATRSAITSTIGIAVGGDVIDADYTGEVKVILANHGQADCSYKAGDQIAQLIVERIADADAIEVDDPETTEWGKTGFGSSHVNPKRSITATDEGIKICFLHAENGNNEFFSATDIGYYPPLMRERETLSTANVNAAMTQTMNASFLKKIKMGGKEYEKWEERGSELVRLRESGKKRRNEWIEKSGLQYYEIDCTSPETNPYT